MSIKDEAFKPSVYDAPPENLQAALERSQLFADPDASLETCREAREVPPESVEESKNRIQAAGIYATNLIGMVWKNVEQFVAVMKEFGWETEVYCHQVMMDAGRYKVYVGIAKADRNNRIGFFLWQKPHSVTVLTAKNLSSSDGTKKQLKEMAELMRQYSGDIEEL